MLSIKAQSITPSITMSISSRVKELKSQGEDIINLSIGEPDFTTPDAIKKSGCKAIEDNITKYDAAAGNAVLRHAVADKLKNENGVHYQADQIVVTNGAKQAITNALIAILDPGDEVIVPTPYWVSYPEIIALCGGVTKIVKTDKATGFILTLEDLKKNITDKTKAVLINNPSNPTGNVYSKEALTEICTFLADRGILIIADEIYERIVFDEPFCSIPSISQKVYDHTILINGLSKSVSMTGWRMGYTATSQKLAKAMASIQSHLTGHSCTITQAASITALKDCEEDIKQMVAIYKERRDFIVQFFQDWKGLDIIPPKGAFYIFIDISSLRPYLSGDLSMSFCSEILEQQKVALVPGISFGEDDFVRMSYAASMDDIQEGLNRIKTFVDTIKK